VSAPAPLDGRVALVTGGARGIGAAIARELVAGGAKVLVVDSGTSIDGDGNDPTIAEAVAKTLGPGARAFTESIASPSAAKAAVDAAVSAFGGIDIVVNNAAIQREGFVYDADPADFEAVVRNNLMAPWYLLNAATPILRAQKDSGRAHGRIVNMVSTAGLYGSHGQVGDASAKAGLYGMTRVAAMDMASAGCTANAIAPFARTRVTEVIQPANEAQKTYKERAMRVEADHIGRFVAWLCSDSAAKVSGQLFGVRGRQILLFAAPRPMRHAVAPNASWGFEELATQVGDWRKDFTPLMTDLEAFNTEPHV
jgi:NAD(P)-dependent dehydrogenase (short-subunit alcohol dehydrogenase family)